MLSPATPDGKEGGKEGWEGGRKVERERVREYIYSELYQVFISYDSIYTGAAHEGRSSDIFP